ncbi:peptidylprolyl isomerase [Vibrio sp. SS-MA-C1-2]|uniref:peptidylprolyl isomerase n=1 Tax=Vibrio sp. SS-MA-C1-2 TaxID=2908646 RepID=UPI001F48AE35|nr:peptidylprolyl isomerase [Vibrio sp. SS-MA-C1-2]UJF19768.1 peptidylprolyl isomerase [Vibrio sp. SS-MA-C1-2]
MMDRLREGANSLVIKIILGIIIFSFVFAGVGSYLGGGSEQIAANVNGTKITQRQFERTYQNDRNRMQQQYGDAFNQLAGNPAYIQQLRKSVLNQMVNNLLLDQQASDLGLRVSDEQIKQAIFQTPQFQVDGKFNNDSYMALIRNMGMTPDMFAEQMRLDMTRNQLIAAVEGSEFTLPSETDHVFKLQGQERAIRTAIIKSDDFNNKVIVNDDEIQKFYDDNQQMFMRPDQVKMAYIELSADKLKDTVTVSDKEAKTYYDENISKYSTTEERDVSHILIKGDSSDAKAKAEKLLTELKAGADFATLAEDNSDDYSAKNGGDLGWIERGVTDPAFEKAAFGLKNAGDFTDVVKSDFGYHIIELNKVKAPDAKPFESVKESIIAQIKDKKAIDEFYQLQTKLADKAFESPDSLDDAAAAINAKVETTDFISPESAKGTLADSKVMSAAFSSDVRDQGLNSDVIDLGSEHVIVVRVDDSRAASVRPFTDVKADVKARLTATKAHDMAVDTAGKLLAALKAGDATELLKADHVSFGEEQTVTRQGGIEAAISQVVYRLAKPVEGKATYGMTQNQQGDSVVIELNQVNDPQPLTAEQQAQFGQQVGQMQAQSDLTYSLESMKKAASINSDILEGTAQ